MTTNVSPAELKAKINSNALHLERLLAEFQRLGFGNMRAIAQCMSDKTNTPFYRYYRALLHMANSPKYFSLMEQTLEQLKQE